MSIMCIIASHNWNGCKCERCGKLRNESHKWVDHKCSICGKQANATDETALLIKGIERGNLPAVISALSGKADPNATDTQGVSILSRAIDNGLIDIAKELVRAGADVNHMVNDLTLLMSAALMAKPDIVHLLISSGANIDQKRSDGCTAFMAAAELPYNINDPKALLVVDKDDIPKRSEVIRAILAAKGNINAKNNEGMTALFFASRSAHQNAVELLISAGADLNSKTNKGMTPLIGAAINGHNGVVKSLQKSGADLNAADANGFTALMYAAAFGHEVVARVLIEAGADRNVSINNTITALALATQKGHAGIINMLTAPSVSQEDSSSTKMGRVELLEAALSYAMKGDFAMASGELQKSPDSRYGDAITVFNNLARIAPGNPSHPYADAQISLLKEQLDWAKTLASH